MCLLTALLVNFLAISSSSVPFKDLAKTDQIDHSPVKIYKDILNMFHIIDFDLHDLP